MGTVTSAAALRTYFETDDKPTSAQFSDLIESFAHKVSGSGTAKQVGALGAGSFGSSMFGAANTAAAHALLDRGAHGAEMYEAATTASAHGHLGAGTHGIRMLEAGTTASAQGHLGGGTVGIRIFEASTTASANSIVGGVDQATSAQAAGGAATGVYMNPQHISLSPFGVRAYAACCATPVVKESKRVSAVTKSGTGLYAVTFAPALPTADYAVFFGNARHSEAAGAQNIINVQGTAGGLPTVSGFGFEITDHAGTLTGSNGNISLMVLCSGQ